MRDALSAYPFREAIRWSLRRETAHADGIRTINRKEREERKVLFSMN
jgi:hypothetical protein